MVPNKAGVPLFYLRGWWVRKVGIGWGWRLAICLGWPSMSDTILGEVFGYSLELI